MGHKRGVHRWAQAKLGESSVSSAVSARRALPCACLCSTLAWRGKAAHGDENTHAAGGNVRWLRARATPSWTSGDLDSHKEEITILIVKRRRGFHLEPDLRCKGRILNGIFQP